MSVKLDDYRRDYLARLVDRALRRANFQANGFVYAIRSGETASWLAKVKADIEVVFGRVCELAAKTFAAEQVAAAAERNREPSARLWIAVRAARELECSARLEWAALEASRCALDGRDVLCCDVEYFAEKAARMVSMAAAVAERAEQARDAQRCATEIDRAALATALGRSGGRARRRAHSMRAEAAAMRNRADRLASMEVR